MAEIIPVSVKARCCELKREGKSNREIYEGYFLPETNSTSSFRSFRTSLGRWMRRTFADPSTLEAGTYEGFIAHDATVQVSKTGEIIQAWSDKGLDLELML